MPLALEPGDGAELRRPLGIVDRGRPAGLARWLTLYTTPVIYLYLDRLSPWPMRRRGHRTIAAD